MSVALPSSVRPAVPPIPKATGVPGWARPLTFVVIVTVAYLFTFVDLIRTMGYDTPLAYLGLVPFLALGVGMWRHRVAGAETAPTTAMDVAVAGMLVTVAAIIAVGGPVFFNAYTWWVRPDLLSLPLFAAGMLALLFGVGAFAWAGRAIAFAFLVWPVPYQAMLAGVLSLLTEWTVAAMRLVAWAAPLGISADENAPGLFRVLTPQGVGEIGISSACAGFESVSSFLFIGGAALLVAEPLGKTAKRRGAIGRGLAWLACGVALAVVGNFLRILAIFLAARAQGVDFAIDVVHPYAGTLALALVVAIMALLLPRFGFALPGTTATPVTSRPMPWANLRVGGATGAGIVVVLLALAWVSEPLWNAVGREVIELSHTWAEGPLRVGAALAMLAMLVLVVAQIPTTAVRGEQRTATVPPLVVAALSAIIVIGSLGTLFAANTAVVPARTGESTVTGNALRNYEETLPALATGKPTFYQPIPWIRQYLGADGTRNVYEYAMPAENEYLFAIIDTASSRPALDAYSLWNCYSWHGFYGMHMTTVPIGRGVAATVINWYDSQDQLVWSSYSWTQPVIRDGVTVNQRIALNAAYPAAYPTGEIAKADLERTYAGVNTRAKANAAAIFGGLWPSA